jgi:hypothetical protein
MKPSQQKDQGPHPGAPTIRPPTFEPTLEQICERANLIYLARHGVTGLELNDWLEAEQELRRNLLRK